MALVEVVRLDATPQSVVDTAFAFVKSIGKTPVLCRDTPGFVVNRLLVPYMAQAMKLLDDDVASFRDVDTAMKLGAGYPMGPFTLADYGEVDRDARPPPWTQRHPPPSCRPRSSLPRVQWAWTPPSTFSTTGAPCTQVSPPSLCPRY